MKSLFFFFSLVLLTVSTYSQNNSIKISSIQNSIDDCGLYTILYDLNGSEDIPYNVSMFISLDGGNEFLSVAQQFLTGDIYEQYPGLNKKIVWDGKSNLLNTFSTHAKIKLVANIDLTNSEISIQNNGNSSYETQLSPILECNNAIWEGILIEGEEANGVKFKIPYSFGNGESFWGKSIYSSEIQGLTATLNPGFLEVGEGFLTFEVTGVPRSLGKVVFPIDTDIELGTGDYKILIPDDCNPSTDVTPRYDIDVMTYNIKIWELWQDVFLHPNAWLIRKSFVYNIIKRADIIGLQEVKSVQFEDLKDNLINHNWYGVNNEDENSDEFSPIFYNRFRFTLLDSGTFWLSETPDTPSKGWDADHNRVCSWVKLFDESEEKIFYFFNTHLDYKDIAKVEGAKLVIRKIRQIAGSDNMVILTGDMNTYENSTAYNILVGKENHVVDGIPSHLKDSKYLSSTPYVGMPETANNWFEPTSGPIDYILTFGMIVNN